MNVVEINGVKRYLFTSSIDLVSVIKRTSFLTLFKSLITDNVNHP